MNVTIDKTNMRFVAKHDNISWLSLLSHIEHPHVAIAIHPCDEPRDFDAYTDLELRMLIKSTTGSDHINAYRPSLLLTCCALAHQLEVTPQLNGFFLELQANAIPPGDEKRYRYLPEGLKPVRMPDLWEPAPMRCEQRWDEAKLAALRVRNPAPGTLAPAAQRSGPVAPATPRQTGEKMVTNWAKTVPAAPPADYIPPPWLK